VVIYPDTVVNPRAMVVEPFDTTVADSTVFGAWCPQNFAVRTHLAGMHFGKHIYEFKVRFYVAGVNYARHEERNSKNYRED